MPNFAFLDFSKLIPRKIWVTEKSWNFHTVCTNLSEQCFSSFTVLACLHNVSRKFFLLQEVQNYYGTRLLLIAQKEWSFCHFAKYNEGHHYFTLDKTISKIQQKLLTIWSKDIFKETCFFLKFTEFLGIFFKLCETLCPNRSLTENNGTKSQFPVLEKFLFFSKAEKLKNVQMQLCVYITV